MSTLAEFRAAIKTTLEADARVAGVKIYEHGGDFDRHELKRYAVQLPAVVISLMRVDVETQADVPIAHVMVSAMVLTQDKSAERKDLASMRVVGELLNILCRGPRQRWGLTDTGTPTDAKALNCYTKEINAEGVAIWAVTWVQKFELTPSALVEDGFDTLDVKYDLAPRDNDAVLGDVIDAEDEIDLT